MVSMTLSVPSDLKKDMDEFPEMNWSEIAREAIKKRLFMMKAFREFTKDSEITEEDAIRWGREVNEKASKKFMEAYNRSRC